jgi:SAM-dependent methyltransferase
MFHAARCVRLPDGPVPGTAPDFADFAGASGTVWMGCGPGASRPSRRPCRRGARGRWDPSEPFVAAARERFPGVPVHLAPAESLPFEDGAFDTALAQLVVHFMSDPVGGVREMARVTRADGVVAACVWDMGQAPLTPFWRAARELRPNVEGERQRPGRGGSARRDLPRSRTERCQSTALASRSARGVRRLRQRSRSASARSGRTHGARRGRA